MSITPVPGEQLHFLKSGLIFGTVIGSRKISEVSRRGQTITITQAMIDGTKDREGKSWLDYLGDPERQIARWGREMFRPGPAPATLTPWEPDSPEQDLERDRRRAAAWAITDPQARAEALREVDKAFGRASTSRTLKSVRGGER